MTEIRIVSRPVKMMLIEKCQYLLERVGCDVVRSGAGDRIKLEITIPPDSQDPHGERLNAARAASMR